MIGPLTRKRWLLGIGVLALASAGTIPIALFQGGESISPVQGITLLYERITGTATSPGSPLQTILFEIRLPRILLAALAGAALALVGTTLQSLLRNPLADPYLLGISGGAALGVSGVILLGPAVGVPDLPFWVPSVAAVCGGFLTLLLVYRLSLQGGRLSIQTLLLAGIAVNAVTSSLILLMTAFADPVRISRMVFWLMGTLNSPGFPLLITLAILLLAGMAVPLIHAREFNLLPLGEEAARSLGTDVERVKRWVFVTAAFLTGIVVAFTGPIGFVGILVPHILRLLIGTDHRLLIPASALGGAGFLVLADTLARTAVNPAEIPVGVITALLGGPVFIYLLKTKRLGVS